MRCYRCNSGNAHKYKMFIFFKLFPHKSLQKRRACKVGLCKECAVSIPNEHFISPRPFYLSKRTKKELHGK